MPVRIDVQQGRALLSLDRPAKRNALDRAMLESLRDAVDVVRGHPGARVIVVRGSGGAFSAGADIADWIDPGPALAAELSRLGTETFRALAALPQPSIAVVEGPAVGGGLELALACDIRIAAEEATLGFPEARLGNTPAWGGVARLVQAAGLTATRRLLLTGDTLDAAEAARLGIVSRSCPAAELEALVEATVASVLACDPAALGRLKTVLADLETRVPGEEFMAAYSATSPDSRQRKRQFMDGKARARAASGSTPPAITARPSPVDQTPSPRCDDEPRQRAQT